jgi:hypothetical protein
MVLIREEEGCDLDDPLIKSGKINYSLTQAEEGV